MSAKLTDSGLPQACTIQYPTKNLMADVRNQSVSCWSSQSNGIGNEFISELSSKIHSPTQ